MWRFDGPKLDWSRKFLTCRNWLKKSMLENPAAMLEHVQLVPPRGSNSSRRVLLTANQNISAQL
ncbi:unnamed protein product [Prunus armeniaca]|uniref:Uncharacterized protein n=1 Tax=Prunus armeniaca TaxID=36596 RepID=A0A6J5V188_PRUAR|nr:unnamed protein product [Prunus armeniaca]